MPGQIFTVVSTSGDAEFIRLVEDALRDGYYILFAFYDHPVDMNPRYVAYLQKPMKDTD